MARNNSDFKWKLRARETKENSIRHKPTIFQSKLGANAAAAHKNRDQQAEELVQQQ